MTLLHHIYAIKNVLNNGPSSISTTFTDRLVAHYLQVTRAVLLERKIDKYYFISEQSYQSLCVDLEESSFHNCCNTPDLDCKVLKSINSIPKFLNSRWGNHLKTMDLTGTVIPEFNLTNDKYSQYALIKPSTGWFIHDNHLYIINNKHLSKVLLNALFNDPEEIYNVNCPDNTGEICKGYYEDEFPIDSDLIDPMYRMTIDLLTQAFRMPNDTENNAKNVETVQANQ